MPGVAGGAPATPHRRTLPNPRAPLSPSKKKVLRYLKILILLLGGFILVFLSLFGVSSLAPFFEAHVLLILEPLGVDFELPS